MSVKLGFHQNFRNKEYTIQPMGLTTIDFEGCTPNYFRVNNMSDSQLFMSVGSMPTEENYDFDAKPRSLSNYCTPFVKDKLYILNNTLTECKIKIMSWSADFDPVFMGVGEVALSHEGAVKTEGIVRGFTVPIPDMDTVLTRLNDLNGKLGGIDSSVAQIMADVSENNSGGDYTEQLEDIKSRLTDLSTSNEALTNVFETLLQNSDGDAYLETILTKVNNIYEATKPGGKVSSIKQLSTTNGVSNGISVYNITSSSVAVYIGEIVSPTSDLANNDATDIRIGYAVTGNGTTINHISTIDDWNKICHIVKCKTLQVQDLTKSSVPLTYAEYNF